ncbi:Helix-turn-helix, AraC domain protein [Segniliparus rotundus DSM 44985]|uniref:Helix-turn-helix, AraC domain protein n=1 Tax=Segniliparus rotundus (strain ATCC BAA-972 / CDC 1076 / CIP 108378 / DSM 44985 / JCM 13578) TaxID=640132 RepID=D6ZFR2_SEGRD|nr:Helix-turn-helix, AraC domain protein [Segniliparus rotundus DSM 44985]
MLRPENAGAVFELRTAPPPERLARYIDWFWSARWDLRVPQPWPAHVISYPSVHVTAEAGAARYGQAMPAELVHGVVTRRFDIDLSGTGYSYGIRFAPGAFTALTGKPAHVLTDRVVRLRNPALSALHDCGDDEARLASLITAADALRVTKDDGHLDQVAALVADIRSSPVTAVAQIAVRHALSERSVQRLLRTYVGVGAQWMIRRCRLHDALAEMHENPVLQLAELATRLGWYDQAHFTRDFTAATGTSPHAYLTRDVRPA